MNWPDDEALFKLIREKLFTAARWAMCWMRWVCAVSSCHPLSNRSTKKWSCWARAMPVLEADCFDDAGFGLMLHALDDLKPNEVYIASGGTPRYALWGELDEYPRQAFWERRELSSTAIRGIRKGFSSWAFRRFLTGVTRRISRAGAR